MSTPEIIPPQPRQPEVTHRQEQYIVPETQQQLGVTTPPQNPQPLQIQDQIVVQPVVTHPGDPQVFQIPSTIAHDQKQLEEGAKGSPELAVTWLDTYWLREMKKAIGRGLKVLFGQ